MGDATRFFLFNMTTGKKKLAYGVDPQDALDVLAMRLSKQEMDLIIRDQYVKVLQRDLQQVVDQLG